MSDVEDLLTRTLHDSRRDLPAPADPLPAIRARVRAQRRHTALAAAAVALVAAAAVLVPAAVRLARPVPVATDPPHEAGLLPWPGRGALAGDAGLLRDAARAWGDAAGPVHLLWAERLGGAETVVLLQGRDRAGRPKLAEVADRGGRLVLVAAGALPDPGVAAVRLVEPADPGRAATFLLVAPAGADSTVALPPIRGAAADSAPRLLPPEPSGLLAVPEELGGRPATVLDRDQRIVAAGEVPPRGTLAVARGPARLTTTTWDFDAGVPAERQWVDARLLAGRLGGGPVEVSLLDASSSVDVPSGRAEPRFYQLRREGREWVAGGVWLRGRPYCLQLREVTEPPDLLTLRCWLAPEQRAIVYLIPATGSALAAVRIDAARSGERPVRSSWAPPLEGSWIATLRPDGPTGAGTVQVVDAAGHRRSVPLPLTAR